PPAALIAPRAVIPLQLEPVSVASSAVVVNPDDGGIVVVRLWVLNQPNTAAAIEHVQAEFNRSEGQRIAEVETLALYRQPGTGLDPNVAAPDVNEACAVYYTFPSETRDARIGVLIPAPLRVRGNQKEQNRQQRNQQSEFQCADFHLFISLCSRRRLADSLCSCFQTA